MKQIVNDIFETLGGSAQTAGKQVAGQVKKTAEDVIRELGLKPDSELAKDEADKAPAHNPQQLDNIKSAEQSRTIARYKQIQAEIKQLEDKRKKELPAQVTGKPGFDEGKMVKQLETGEAPKDEKKLPPLPVQRASKKAEAFRGASG